MFILLFHIVEDQKQRNVYLINNHESAITAANQKVHIICMYVKSAYDPE